MIHSLYLKQYWLRTVAADLLAFIETSDPNNELTTQSITSTLSLLGRKKFLILLHLGKSTTLPEPIVCKLRLSDQNVTVPQEHMCESSYFDAKIGNAYSSPLSTAFPRFSIAFKVAIDTYESVGQNSGMEEISR